MKDAIVAKVAAQAAEYYQDAYRMAASPMVKSMWEKVRFTTVTKERIIMQHVERHFFVRQSLGYEVLIGDLNLSSIRLDLLFVSNANCGEEMLPV